MRCKICKICKKRLRETQKVVSFCLLLTRRKGYATLDSRNVKAVINSRGVRAKKRFIEVMIVRGEKLPDGSVIIISESAEETEELGVKIGRLLNSGDLLFLWGDLGSGKTLFVRGITCGLHTEELATSPTFALVHKYEGRIPVYHLDLYRLNSPNEVGALALEEMESEGAVIVVEWGGYAADLLSSQRLEIFFERGQTDNERKIRLQPRGGYYTSLIKELVEDAGFRD